MWLISRIIFLFVNPDSSDIVHNTKCMFLSSKKNYAVACSQKVAAKKSAEPHLDSARFLRIADVLK